MPFPREKRPTLMSILAQALPSYISSAPCVAPAPFCMPRSASLANGATILSICTATRKDSSIVVMGDGIGLLLKPGYQCYFEGFVRTVRGILKSSEEPTDDVRNRCVHCGFTLSTTHRMAKE
ncbi:hypothetical protein DM02DRAFT_651226 [Periconia macrospinosa]|uniref:Uncharacterized protein n=1 Tax=Periconia macrospinosa TaxID=97972 RepID=A0A2V1E389_9PLEO|nr:hypothetical protein DM02DRAFT_651226 [Periconia macrospinosa]